MARIFKNTKIQIQQKKIFIGPHEVAGFYSHLSKGFKQLGVEHDYITHNRHRYSYGGQTKFPLLLAWAFFFHQVRTKKAQNVYLKALTALIDEVLKNLWGLITIFKYDVFIFGFGHTLLRNNFDLYVLKLLKKCVIIQLHGSEVRPPYCDGAIKKHVGDKTELTDFLFLKAIENKNRMEKLQKLSNFLIGAPLSSAQFATKPFINFFEIGIPHYFDPSQETNNVEVLDQSKNEKNRAVRILHCPSDPEAKGTKLIAEAIKRLKKKGYHIEYIERKNILNEEVIEEIKKCDFVVDQLYSTTPLAGFAKEAACFAKPTVVGGYGFSLLRALLNEDVFPPAQICHPSDIERSIETLIKEPRIRKALGNDAQRFVREKWSASAVACCFLKLMSGDIPDHWWIDPFSFCYLSGGFQSENETKKKLRKLIDEKGVSSLQLNHNPSLEKAFVDFANS